jgi:hypothetical protein
MSGANDGAPHSHTRLLSCGAYFHMDSPCSARTPTQLWIVSSLYRQGASAQQQQQQQHRHRHSAPLRLTSSFIHVEKTQCHAAVRPSHGTVRFPRCSLRGRLSRGATRSYPRNSMEPGVLGTARTKHPTNQCTKPSSLCGWLQCDTGAWPSRA